MISGKLNTLLFTALCITVTYSENMEFIEVFKDFLLMEKRPAKVFLYLCWPAKEKVLVAKYLNKYSFSFQFSTQLKLPIFTKSSEQLFLIDIRCTQYVNLLYMANLNKLFQQPYRWFLIVNELITLPHFLEILVDSQLYIVRNASPEMYMISSIYKISKYSENFTENDVARWSRNLRFSYFHPVSAVRNRTNLLGMAMNISYVITNNDSLNHLWDYRDKHIDGISKLNYILSHHIIDAINVSGHFIMRSTWGYRNVTTNLYDGLVGDLQSGLAEFAGTASFFTPDRILIVDYIAPTTPTRAKFIFRAPPLSYVTNVFTQPFDTLVWYASFLLLAIISIILYVIVKWEWSSSKFRNILSTKQNVMKPKYIDVLLMELGAICQQGSETEPKSGAGQITVIVVFLTFMFLYTSYSANIVALLQSTSDSIQTVDDLLNSRIKLGVEDKPYSYYYFKIQTEKTRKAIYTQKVAPVGQKPNFMNVEEGIRRMKDEFFAFHVECASGYKIVADIFQESEKCGLREIEYWQIIDPWVAVKKNSSYKELAKVAYRKLHESGIQNREYRRLYAKKPVCQSRGSNFISVGLIDCYFAFLIFGVGILITIVILFIEILYKCRKRFQQKLHT